MFPKYFPPTFTGNHFEVGYQHAEWWLNYLARPGCEDYDRYCRSSLRRSWQPRFAPLLENTEAFAPEVASEIHGMCDALVANGVKTDYLNVFAVCLGETGYKGSQCTAFVTRAENSLILSHNEEEDGICPLCIASVNIHDAGKVKSFVAASYPFQLPGSAFGGVNRHLAFQGNSIGYSKYIKQIESSWGERIPKTVFSRKFLEASSLKEVLLMCSEFLFSLPSHSFFIDDSELYSLEIRPLARYKLYPLHQVSLNKISTSHCHVNHFIKINSIDLNWTWKNKRDIKEGVERLFCIQDKVNSIGQFTSKKCMSTMKKFAADERYSWKTSASFVVTSNVNGLQLVTNNYFNRDKYTLTP